MFQPYCCWVSRWDGAQSEHSVKKKQKYTHDFDKKSFGEWQMKWVSMRWKDRMYKIDFGELLAWLRSTKEALCLVTFPCYTLSSNQPVNANQCVNQSESRNTIFRQALCAVTYCNMITAHIHSFRRQAHVATIQCHKTADVDATEESWKDCKKVITRYELCALCAQTIRFAFCRQVSKVHFQQMYLNHIQMLRQFWASTSKNRRHC